MSLNVLRRRIQHDGGEPLNRIKKQKLKSLQAALLNDYNSRQIETEQGIQCLALINTKTVTADYDKQYISVPFDAGLHEGDTFEILDNNTHFMVYLPDLVEIAYLRAEIIRCCYNITINDKLYWLYFKGPDENKIDWNLKENTSFNDMNYTGILYVKKNDDTKEFFKRFSKIKVADKTWEVQATDVISVPGIIEVSIKEYFTNETEDLPQISKQPDIIDERGDVNSPVIIGQTVVKDNAEIGYSIIDAIYSPSISWRIEGDAEIVDTYENGKMCKIKPAENGKEFILSYGDYRLSVQISSTYPIISGEKEVYPYNVYEYHIDDKQGEFFIDSPMAEVVVSKGNECKVKILSGKKGKFTLFFVEADTENVYELPIKILSL